MVVLILDICLAALTLHIVARLAWKRRTALPPGPPGWPLIGNLLDFPTHAPYKTFGPMSKIYGKSMRVAQYIYVAHAISGPIISFKVLGTRYVVLNSHKANVDLFEKRSTVTSNRPHFTMAGDLIGWRSATAFLQYGDTHRKHRKFVHRQIGTKSSLQTFYPAEEEEVKKFLRNLLQSPDDVVGHCRRYGIDHPLGSRVDIMYHDPGWLVQ